MSDSRLNCIFNDIRPDSVKIGMVSGSNIIEAIVDRLGHHRAKNIVVDNVMVSTSGSKLLSAEAMDAVITKLIPIADIITPNIPEAQAICNISISNTDDMERAAEKMSKMLKGAVLIKGGHLTDTADDLLYANGRILWIRGERVNNPNNHGTGCTLSSAIACNLAQGLDIEISVRNAKNYITGALKSNLNLGRGRGPLNHVWEL